MSRWVVVRLAAVACLVMVASSALANGRFPATRGFHSSANGQTILIPATFGLVLSTDGGSSYHWVCERALGYAGTYDPEYVLMDGEWWISNFEGLSVSRDGGCTWTPFGPPFEGGFVGALSTDASGALWVATTSEDVVTSNGIYVRDPGQGQFRRLPLDIDRAWWSDLQVAPSDQQSVYASGYVINFAADNDAGIDDSEPFLVRSRNRGQTWEQLPIDGIDFGARPEIYLEAVAPNNPELIFVRIQEALVSGGDVIYRSANGGTSYQQVLALDDPIDSFLFRSDGSAVIVGTANAGVHISTDAGVTWRRAATEPKMGCLEESDSQLYACAANWEPDFFALGRSDDGENWTKIFGFENIGGPLICDRGTEQRDYCTTEVWPGLAQQLNLTGDAEPDAGPGGNGGGGGCGCSAAAVVILLWWPRRRRKSLKLRGDFL
jgi:hypothetical protein